MINACMTLQDTDYPSLLLYYSDGEHKPVPEDVKPRFAL